MSDRPNQHPPYLWLNFEQAAANHEYARSLLTAEQREEMDRDMLELGHRLHAGLLKARARKCRTPGGVAENEAP